MPNIDTPQVVTLRGIMPAYCPALSDESLFGAVARRHLVARICERLNARLQSRI
jgi:hypothetical protein